LLNSRSGCRPTSSSGSGPSSSETRGRHEHRLRSRPGRRSPNSSPVPVFGLNRVPCVPSPCRFRERWTQIRSAAAAGINERGGASVPWHDRLTSAAPDQRRPSRWGRGNCTPRSGPSTPPRSNPDSPPTLSTTSGEIRLESPSPQGSSNGRTIRTAAHTLSTFRGDDHTRPVNGSGRGMTTGTAFVRSTTTPWRGCGRRCGRSAG
jgi:hypothetical protein